MNRTFKISATILGSIIVIGSLIYSSRKQVLPSRADIVLYDSLGNIVAFKHKKEWTVLNEKQTAEALLKEIIRINQNDQIILRKLDSVTRITQAKK